MWTKILRFALAAAMAWAGPWSPAWAAELALVGARVYMAPDAAPIEDGTPVYVRDLFRQVQAPGMEVASAQQGQARAQQQLSDGADGLKLFAGAIVGGKVGVLPMDKAIATAIVQAAHRAHKHTS